MARELQSNLLTNRVVSPDPSSCPSLTKSRTLVPVPACSAMPTSKLSSSPTAWRSTSNVPFKSADTPVQISVQARAVAPATPLLQPHLPHNPRRMTTMVPQLPLLSPATMVPTKPELRDTPLMVMLSEMLVRKSLMIWVTLVLRKLSMLYQAG